MRLRLLWTTLPGLVLTSPVVAQQPGTGPQVHVMAFGDVDYLATDRPATPSGFQLGQFVGHVNATLTDRLTVFGEFSLTAHSNEFTVADERLIVRYDFGDFFKLSLGRYHTPVSYWNVAYHHGSWLQTSVARPEMVKVGSDLLPVHFVGVLAEGSVPAGGLGLGYWAGVGNGRDGTISLPGDAGDVNGRRAALAGLRLRPASLYGLEIGGGAYFDEVSPQDGEQAAEQIWSGHAAYDRQLQVIVEAVRVRHRPTDRSLPTAGANAGYVQLGYRLPGQAHGFMPYGRWERISVDREDVVLGALGLDYDAVLGGVRYDFAPFAALKAEWRNERFAAARRTNSLWLQAAFVVTGQGNNAM